MKYSPISITSFAMACGTTWGLICFLMGILGLAFKKGLTTIDLIAEWYVGFAPTVQGALIGIGYGFVDGFIGGTILAWFYNIYLGKRRIKEN